MDARDVALRTIALILLTAVAAGVLVVAPSGLRLFIALLAMPLETIILVSLLGSPSRRVPLP